MAMVALFSSIGIIMMDHRTMLMFPEMIRQVAFYASYASNENNINPSEGVILSGESVTMSTQIFAEYYRLH